MKRNLYIAGGGFFALLVIFLAVNPNHVPSFFLVIPFILLFTLLLSGILYLLGLRGVNNKKSIKIASLCASLPILLIVLQSIGQLTIRDVLTVLLLFAISYFYISRTAASS